VFFESPGRNRKTAGNCWKDCAALDVGIQTPLAFLKIKTGVRENWIENILILATGFIVPCRESKILVRPTGLKALLDTKPVIKTVMALDDDQVVPAKAVRINMNGLVINCSC
jgi:hypothetical protein